MSKLRHSLYIVCFALFQILQIFTNSSAAAVVPAEVEIDITKAPTVTVTGKGNNGTTRNFALLRSAAGIDGIADRISEVRLFDADGSEVGFKRLMAGEYLGESRYAAWSYSRDISPFADPRAAAHTSWIASDNGLLFLRDLMPVTNSGPVLVRFKRVPGQKISYWDASEPDGRYLIENTDDAVFRLGEYRTAAAAFADVNISGKRNFDDAEAAEFTMEILREYEKVFGMRPPGRFSVNIIPFPQNVPPGTWEAETIGRTVVIISADMPFKTRSLQRLHEQLRHELFHLWLPNAVELTGNYDWFYEGFALYQSLKTGLAVNRIRFADFLDTISRAANADVFAGKQISLIDASKDRAGVSNTRVYARGLAVAFLCDAEIMRASKGKRSIGDILRSLVKEHRGKVPADGNNAVIEILKREPGLRPIIERWINGSEKLDMSGPMGVFGLENTGASPRTVLKVREKRSGRQKDLLDKLGYNNWRKSLRNNK